MTYPTTLDDAASLYFVDAGETILAAHHNILADRVVKLEAKLGIGLANAADADPDDVLMIQPDGSTLWTPLGSTLGTMALQNANAVNITGGSISNLTGDIAISGNVSATAFIGSGAGLTGIGSGTGGVINTGSTTIGADSDDNRVGIISFQIGGEEKWAIGNDDDNLGYLGWGTNAPEAVIDAAALPGGGTQVLRMRTNEAGSGDFGISFFANDFGVSRHDNQMLWGYNIGGPNQVVTEHSFVYAIESRYGSDELNQLEHYIQVDPGVPGESTGPWAISYRPFGITQNLQTFECVAVFKCPSVVFVGLDNDNGWMSVLSRSGVDGVDGDLFFDRNAGVVFAETNTRQWPIGRTGQGMVGSYDGKFALLETGGVDTSMVLFAGGSPSTNSYKLLLGGASGDYKSFGWNTAAGGRFEYTARTEADTYIERGINDELGKYQFQWGLSRALAAASGSYSEIGAFTPDVGSGLVEMVISDAGGDTGRRFTLASNYPSYSASGWHEVPPDTSSGDRDGDFAVDIQGATGMMRLRRTSTSSGSKTYYITVKSYSQFASVRFTPATGTGTGASVGGLFANKAISEVGGVLYFNDSSIMQPVTIGATDSGGSGYRLLRIPN